MLRGLDASGAALSGYEPPVVDLSRVERFDGSVTLYVHESPSSSGHRRFRAASERLDLLADAGAVAAARFVTWPERVRLSAPGTDATVCSLYERFLEAAGAAALDPFFERSGDELAVPELAAAVRHDGRLVGLYPRSAQGDVESVEDGISRLLCGEEVENL